MDFLEEKKTFEVMINCGHFFLFFAVKVIYQKTLIKNNRPYDIVLSFLSCVQCVRLRLITGIQWKCKRKRHHNINRAVLKFKKKKKNPRKNRVNTYIIVIIIRYEHNIKFKDLRIRGDECILVLLYDYAICLFLFFSVCLQIVYLQWSASEVISGGKCCLVWVLWGGNFLTFLVIF